MTERPILFRPRMAAAVDHGSKTQTRRIMKFKPLNPGLNMNFSGLEIGYYFTDMPISGYVLRSRGNGGTWNDRTFALRCPYGQPGDRLWVRETWGADNWDYIKEYKAEPWRGDPDPMGAQIHYYAAEGKLIAMNAFPKGYWKPSIHMPRWACRTILGITNIHAERLQDITDNDAIAEGFNGRDDFKTLFCEINGADVWIRNPWVWVLEFKKLGGQA